MNASTLVAPVAPETATPSSAGPAWAARTLNEVRILDADLKLVRSIGRRAELEAFASWCRRAPEVSEPTSGFWTHRIDVDVAGGGRWLYDASSGHLTSRGTAAPVYRLAREDRARLAAFLVTGN